jgi:hypothetical protein
VPSLTDVYLERGSKRVFAGGLAWPGWCRSGRDETAALEALVAFGPRYAEVVRGAGAGRYRIPRSPEELAVAERLKGDATTDFGAPSIAPSADDRPLDARELRRQLATLEACWVAFDRMAEASGGRPLAKGPRGGGRDLDAIVGHVAGAEASYVRRLGATPPTVAGGEEAAAWPEIRACVLEAVTRGVSDGLPTAGPRGGKIWKLRYFVRRTAWHVLDHAWEIEDRVAPPPAPP